MACLMLQAVRRDENIEVPCRVFRSDDERPAPTERRQSLSAWFAQGYDGPDSRPGCTGFGRSIFPRPGVSSHRGYPLFNSAQTSIRALQRACDRERSRSDGDWELVWAVDAVIGQMRVRNVDEIETLTFHSGEGIHAPQPKAKGKGKGQRFGRGRRAGYRHS